MAAAPQHTAQASEYLPIKPNALACDLAGRSINGGGFAESFQAFTDFGPSQKVLPRRRLEREKQGGVPAPFRPADR